MLELICYHRSDLSPNNQCGTRIDLLSIQSDQSNPHCLLKSGQSKPQCLLNSSIILTLNLLYFKMGQSKPRCLLNSIWGRQNIEVCTSSFLIPLGCFMDPRIKYGSVLVDIKQSNITNVYCHINNNIHVRVVLWSKTPKDLLPW